MSDKFTKNVKKPENLARNFRKNVGKLKAKNIGGEVIKKSAMGVAGITQFMFWATRLLAVDNKILRKLEDVFSKTNPDMDKSVGLKYFAKKHPNLSAHILYYSIPLLMFAGFYTADSAKDMASQIKTEVKKTEKGNIDFNEKILDPNSEDFLGQCAALFDVLYPAILYAETYYKTPKVNRAENVYTYGPGVTYFWPVDKNNEINFERQISRKNGRPGQSLPNINVNDTIGKKLGFDYCTSTTYTSMGQTDKASLFRLLKNNLSDPISINDYLALCIAGYQLPGHLKSICKNGFNGNKSDEQKANSFMYGAGAKSKYPGTINKRWVCAALATGQINSKQFLDAYIDGFFAINYREVIKNDEFDFSKEFIEKMMSGRQHKSDMTLRERLNQKTIPGWEYMISCLENQSVPSDFYVSKSQINKIKKDSVLDLIDNKIDNATNFFGAVKENKLDSAMIEIRRALFNLSGAEFEDEEKAELYFSAAELRLKKAKYLMDKEEYVAAEKELNAAKQNFKISKKNKKSFDKKLDNLKQKLKEK